MAETPYVELYIDQGTDFSTTVDLTDDLTGADKDITGIIFTGNLKRSIVSTNVEASFTCAVSNAVGGEVIISMDAANTATLRPGRYFFDILKIDTLQGNTKSRLMSGIVEVTAGITL